MSPRVKSLMSGTRKPYHRKAEQSEAVKRDLAKRDRLITQFIYAIRDFLRDERGATLPV